MILLKAMGMALIAMAALFVAIVFALMLFSWIDAWAIPILVFIFITGGIYLNLKD